ncbi:MAG: hypothetical protein WBQ50_09150, partial [Nocardioides sp.]
MLTETIDQQAAPAPERPPREVRRYARGALAGAVTGALVATLRILGHLDGQVALALVAGLSLLAPTSSILSRRLLIVSALVLGWIPLVWWLPLDLGRLDRTGLLLAASSAALVGWTCAAPRMSQRARRLIPQVALMDLAPVLAAALTAWLTWPFLSAASGDRTLNILIKSGWDHAAHFGMTHVIRAEGAITPYLGPAPDGQQWVGSNYPQHFHASLAALTELTHGSTLRQPVVEVLFYGQALALVAVLIALALTAGVAQLPGLRQRPAWGFPVAALLLAVFVFGPGAVAFSTGWPNFVLAVAVAAMAALLGSSTRTFSLCRLAALGGLIIAATHGWAVMGPFAVTGAAIALTSSRLRVLRPPTKARSAGLVGLVLAVTVACLMVLPVLATSGAAGAVSLGGAAEYSMGFLVTSLGAALAVSLAPLQYRIGRWRAADALAVAATPLLALVLLVGLATYQLNDNGQLSYYFGKLAVATTMLGVATVAIALDRAS